jgi:hypothetical protein
MSLSDASVALEARYIEPRERWIGALAPLPVVARG